MDDRAAITALVQAARRLSQRDEIGGVGGSYASRTLPGDLTLAVEVGPTEPEYDTTCSGGPIIAYSDARCVYDKDVADALMAIATQRGLSPKRRCWVRSSPMRRIRRPVAFRRGQGCCACRR